VASVNLHSGVDPNRIPKQLSPFPRRVLLAGCSIALALLCVAAWWRINYLRKTALVHWERQLGSIADITKMAIDGWIQERRSGILGLAEFIGDRPALFADSRSLPLMKKRGELYQEAQKQLANVQRQNNYSGIWVIDAAGRAILSSKNGSSPGSTASSVAAWAIEHKMFQIVGPRYDDQGALILIFAAPISNSPEVLGAVLITVDPSRFLFPLVTSETIPTKTGEYMLVARVDNRFEILSPLRHPPAPPLSIRIPWEKAPRLGRLAIEGVNTSGEFTDFRGVPVIAVARHISGTVGLVRKIDRSEAFADYRTQARTEGLLAIAILAILGLAMLQFRRTERASRLREVAESEARLAGVIRSAMDAIIILDGEQRVTLFNAAAEMMFGWKAGEALDRPLETFIPERFRDGLRRHMEDLWRSGVTARFISDIPDLRGLRRKGEEFPIEASISRIELEDQKLYSVMIRDISERKHAEEMLRKSEEEYRTLFEESKDVVFISTPEGRFVDINPAGVELFGYPSKEELLNADIARDLYTDPFDREEARRVLETKGFLKDYEQTIRCKDGTRRIVLETSNGVRDDKGNIVAYRGFLRDVTERRALEKQLFQAHKMEAVGQLAGGIAHDFNNILTAILGYSDLMQESMPPGSTHRRNAEEITKAARRAASLTRQLLAFSRRQMMKPKVLGLNSLITDMDKMLRRLISENIELSTMLDPALGQVRADPGQIEQVIMNLVVNARDAMPQGGTLTIQTTNADLDERFAAQHLGAQAGSYVTLAVSDTGHGMNAEVQAHIFEPFFTTKEMGKGTGLGLSTVYGIVKQSGGYITVQSDHETGTTFKIYLPRIEAPIFLPEPATPAGLMGGSETILLVEDESSVRALARDILHIQAYTVLEAANGEEAIALCERYEGTIHLMVTDMVMPRMSGRELARHLRSARPKMKVLYMSGYADSDIREGDALEPGSAFLSKPFTSEQLVRELRQLLDEPYPPTGGAQA